MSRTFVTSFTALLIAACAVLLRAESDSRQLKIDEEARTIAVVIDGEPQLTYVHHPRWATPHYFPLRSPSGKDLIIQQTEPFPHHRAIWVNDRIKVGDHPEVDFYHDFKNLKDAKNPAAGYKHFIEHVGVTDQQVAAEGVRFTVAHRWMVNGSTPVMDETHDVGVTDLGNGEYLVDLKFKLTASYGDALFTSDWVHYAWPYIRMHPQFSGESGGVITDDQGRTGQEATNQQVAKWVDFSNTIDGVTEGLAVFIYPDGEEHRWLTREYGTFGPRRADRYSGTRFTLKKGESLTGRVGLLVHRGDVDSGKVAQRYAEYAARE